MRQTDTSTRYRRFLIPSLAFLAVMAIVAVSWASRGAGPRQTKAGVHRRIRKDLVAQAELNVSSRVPGFEIIKLEKHLEGKGDSGRIEVWLRNDTAKAITAYDVAVGIIESQPDLLGGDEPKMLPPGGVIRDSHGIQPELETKGVTIMAAIFEDGSTAGDAKAIQDMISFRQGMQIQCDYSVKLLREVAAAPDSEIPGKISKIETQLACLSNEQEDALPLFAKSGYRFQVDLTRHQLEETVDYARSVGQLSRPEIRRVASLREQLRGHADRYENLLRYMRPKRP